MQFNNQYQLTLRMTVGDNSASDVIVGLHQGAVLSSLLLVVFTFSALTLLVGWQEAIQRVKTEW